MIGRSTRPLKVVLRSNVDRWTELLLKAVVIAGMWVEILGGICSDKEGFLSRVISDLRVIEPLRVCQPTVRRRIEHPDVTSPKSELLF